MEKPFGNIEENRNPCGRPLNAPLDLLPVKTFPRIRLLYRKKNHPQSKQTTGLTLLMANFEKLLKTATNYRP